MEDYEDHFIAKKSSSLSECEVIVLLFLFVTSRSCTSTYASSWLRIIEQVQNIIHKIVLMWVLFVVESWFKRLLKDGDDICAIGCWDKFQRAINLFKELVAAIDSLFLQIYFVCDADARNVRALIAHFSVPVSQIGIGHFSCHIEYQNANVRAKVVSRMQFIERLLTGRVPNVYRKVISVLIALTYQLCKFNYWWYSCSGTLSGRALMMFSPRCYQLNKTIIGQPIKFFILRH